MLEKTFEPTLAGLVAASCVVVSLLLEGPLFSRQSLKKVLPSNVALLSQERMQSGGESQRDDGLLSSPVVKTF